MPSLHDFFSLQGKHAFTPVRRLGAAGSLVALAALTLFFADPVPSGEAGSSGKQRLEAIYARSGDTMPIIDPRGEMAIFEGVPGEPRVDCGAILGPRTMVALIFGQSNASNTVDPGYDSTLPVFAAHAGRCEKVHDALPGASSLKGSSWARLGDRIVASGLYDAVIFVDIARGGSSILNWGPQGDLNALLLGTLEAMQAQGMPPTHVFFHQGEADCAIGLPAEDYKVVLEAVLDQIRENCGGLCPVYVSRASLFLDFACGDRQNPNCYKSCPGIVAAQTEVADPAKGIFAGPNTDMLVPWFNRNDGYHFTAQAADRFAAAWMPLLIREASPVPPIQ